MSLTNSFTIDLKGDKIVRVFTILGKLLDRSTRALRLHHEVSCNLHSSPAGQSHSSHTCVSCHTLATSGHLYDSATKPSRADVLTIKNIEQKRFFVLAILIINKH